MFESLSAEIEAEYSRAANDDMKLNPSVRANVKVANLRSPCVALTFEPKTDLTEIYLDAFRLPSPQNHEIPSAKQSPRTLLKNSE
ncbi:hypothetical protein ACTXT7_010952 [Hymenolepis weldensis]